MPTPPTTDILEDAPTGDSRLDNFLKRYLQFTLKLHLKFLKL